MVEGEEPPEFWVAIGGKPSTYIDTAFYERYSHKVRLFCCSTKSGDFITSEILPFTQADLLPDEVSQYFTKTDRLVSTIYFLDTWHEVYLWIGPESSQSERGIAERTVKEYTEKAAEKRGQQVKLISLVNEVIEPVEFTRHFHAWNMKESVRRSVLL